MSEVSDSRKKLWGLTHPVDPVEKSASFSPFSRFSLFSMLWPSRAGGLVQSPLGWWGEVWNTNSCINWAASKEMQSEPGSQSPHPCVDIPRAPGAQRASLAIRGKLSNVKNLWAAVIYLFWGFWLRLLASVSFFLCLCGEYYASFLCRP